jgi:hypothetical protein
MLSRGWIPSRTVDLTGTARVATRPSLEAHFIRHGPTEYFMQHRTNRTPQIMTSDGEIATNLLIVEHMQLLGGLAHLCDRDQIEIGKKSFASPAHGRIDDTLEQH